MTAEITLIEFSVIQEGVTDRRIMDALVNSIAPVDDNEAELFIAWVVFSHSLRVLSNVVHLHSSLQNFKRYYDSLEVYDYSIPIGLRKTWNMYKYYG